jgi:hypothetical protein
MNTSLRLSLTAGAVAMGLVGLSYLLSDSLPQASAEVSSQQALDPFTQLYHRSEDLEARFAAVTRKFEARCQLARELVAGQRTLLETAVCFRELDRAHADFVWSAFRKTYRGQTDDERHCLHVIATVENVLWPRPREAAAVIARLKAELQEHLKDGPLYFSEE